MSSISDKIVCLGQRHELEDKKLRLLTALTDINNINFDNIDVFTENMDSDAVRHFKEWVQRNRITSGTDELVSNVDSGLAMVDLAKSSYGQVLNLASQIRQTILIASSACACGNDITNYKNDLCSLYDQIKAIYTNTEYNGCVLHDHVLGSTSNLLNSNSSGVEDITTGKNYLCNNEDLDNGSVYYCESGYTIGLNVGNDFSINVSINNIGEYEVENVTFDKLTDGISEFEWRVGMCFTISGSSLGGVDNVNDLTITVNNLDTDGEWTSSDITIEGSGIINVKSFLIQVGLREHVKAATQILLDFTVPSSLSNVKSTIRLMQNNATSMDAKQAIDVFIRDVTAAVSRNLASYTRLVESRNKLLRDYKDLHRQLEAQRAQAKNQLNVDLANIMKTISYLNVCISHNGY